MSVPSARKIILSNSARFAESFNVTKTTKTDKLQDH